MTVSANKTLAHYQLISKATHTTNTKPIQNQMSRWSKVELVVAPTDEGGEPVTLETSAHVLERTSLFKELLAEGDAVIPITNFKAEDVALFVQLVSFMCANADAKCELGRITLPLTVETIERVAPFCDFCGALELLHELVAWVQANASARAVRCIEGLAGGTYEVAWSEAALEVLFKDTTESSFRFSGPVTVDNTQVGDIVLIVSTGTMARVGNFHVRGHTDYSANQCTYRVATDDGLDDGRWVGADELRKTSGSAFKLLSSTKARGLRADTVMQLLDLQARELRESTCRTVM